MEIGGCSEIWDQEGDAEARGLEHAPGQLYIGGEWRDARDGAVIAVEDPATGRALCEVANASGEDAAAAIDAAAEAQREWAATSPALRSEILSRAFELLKRRAEELALLVTLEMGKPLSESRAEIRYAAEYFRWFAGEALRINGSYKVSGDRRSRILVMRQPVGPSYFITPWNFPSALGARKIAPAIAAGCTMVIKPAAQTPLSTLALARVLTECGLPAGVVNVVTGSAASEISAAIFGDPRLRKLSFTGSTEVGRQLLAMAAPNVLRVSMELGGNAPFLVFEDADLDAAVEGALVAKMRNAGQACTAANRFYVAESVADRFADRLRERMSALRLGRGTDEGIDVGPLIDETQRNRVADLVDDAVAKGAEALVGGGRRSGAGYFYEPTVLSGVSDDARVLTEEVFGPVAPVKSFSTEAEAVEVANETEYGLAAYVYTRDVKRALRVSEALEAGMIGLNQGMVSNAGAPFGGVKHSGLGREGGNEGISEFLETKYVALGV